MKVQKDFVSQKLYDKTVLVRTSSSDGFCGIVELNDTAADIWQYLEEGNTVEATAQKLTEKYDVDYDQALSSVIDLSKKMLEQGLATNE